MKGRKREPVSHRGITGFFCSGFFFSPLTLLLFSAVILLTPACYQRRCWRRKRRTPAGGRRGNRRFDEVEEGWLLPPPVSRSASETPGLTIVVTGGDPTEYGQEPLHPHRRGGVPGLRFRRRFCPGLRPTGRFLRQPEPGPVQRVPVNPGPVGEVDLSLFPAAVLARVEISRGPLSPLYGANAMGGVVNIETALSGKNVPVSSWVAAHLTPEKWISS